jgi:hypothetical protein
MFLNSERGPRVGNYILDLGIEGNKYAEEIGLSE